MQHIVNGIWSVEHERAQVLCPACSKPWSSIAYGDTMQTLYYDPVECDCGDELWPPVAIVEKHNPAMLAWFKG